MLSQDDFYVLKGRTYLAYCCKMHVRSSLKMKRVVWLLQRLFCNIILTSTVASTFHGKFVQQLPNL